MGLAFCHEIGKRVAPASTANHQILGGPGFGRPYLPMDISLSRQSFVPDGGGIPLQSGLFCGPETLINLCSNPRAAANATGWTNTTRYVAGGMWGSGGCFAIADQDNTAAALDGYYTYAKGSAIGTAPYCVTAWARVLSSTGIDSGRSDLLDDKAVSFKLRMQDGNASHIIKTANYRKIRASDGWVPIMLSTGDTPPAWFGDDLKFGPEFQAQTAATKISSILLLDGVCLVNSASPAMYFDGSFSGCTWTGASDASTSDVGDIHSASYDLSNVPFNPRDGYVSLFTFLAASPSADDYASAGSIGYTLANLGLDTAKFRAAISGLRTYVNNEIYLQADLGTGSSTVIHQLTGWPQCALHVILAWNRDYFTFGIKGYFDPVRYGLTSNVAISTGRVSPGLLLPTGANAYLEIGQIASIGANCAIWNVCVGKTGPGRDEVKGMLLHGPGPYTGTVFFVPFEEDGNAILCESASCHLGGAFGHAEGGYAPVSGLVTATASGSQPGGELARASTQNVSETISVVGRLHDVQQNLSGISRISQLFEMIHRDGQSRSGPWRSWVYWAYSSLQYGHPALSTFPAPRQVKSGLVSGDLELSPRITGIHGIKGVSWSILRFERWGYWLGPMRRVFLAKNAAGTPAFTFAHQNLNTASSTTDSNYFEVPEGLVDGDLEAPALIYVRAPSGGANLGRIRIARRSRGIPADCTFILEAEAAANTILAGGAEVVDASASGGKTRSLAIVAGAPVNMIQFEAVDHNVAIPDWIYGHWRLITLVKMTGGGPDPIMKARVDVGATAGAWGEAMQPAISNGGVWFSVDLGIFRIPPVDVPSVLRSVGGSAHGLSIVLNVDVSVSDTVFVDAVLLFPADENYVQADRSTTAAVATTGGMAISALEQREGAYTLAVADEIEDVAVLYSRALYLQPGRPNRLVMLTEYTSGSNPTFRVDQNGGSTISLYYTPRYLLMPSYESGGGASWL